MYNFNQSNYHSVSYCEPKIVLLTDKVKIDQVPKIHLGIKTKQNNEDV